MQIYGKTAPVSRQCSLEALFTWCQYTGNTGAAVALESPPSFALNRPTLIRKVRDRAGLRFGLKWPLSVESEELFLKGFAPLLSIIRKLWRARTYE